MALKKEPGTAELSKCYHLSSNHCLASLAIHACAQNCIKFSVCRMASVCVTFQNLYPRL